MKHKISILLILVISVLVVLGCAQKFGGITHSAVEVVFWSDPPNKQFFLISPEENFLLGGNYRPIEKNEKITIFLNKNNRKKIVADGSGEKYRQTEVVMLLDCKEFFQRKLFFFKSDMKEKLQCSNE